MFFSFLKFIVLCFALPVLGFTLGSMVWLVLLFGHVIDIGLQSFTLCGVLGTIIMVSVYVRAD